MRLLSRVADAEERLPVLDGARDAIDVADLLGHRPWTMARLLTSLDESLGALGIRCLVNDEALQDSSPSEMVHDVPALIAFCSRLTTIEPGDVIATGTPAGVGVSGSPPQFLGDGDEVAVEIDGIGRLTNSCRVIEG